MCWLDIYKYYMEWSGWRVREVVESERWTGGVDLFIQHPLNDLFVLMMKIYLY